MTDPTDADLRALERDIVNVFVKHGLTDYDTIQVAAHKIAQDGLITGVTVDAWVYTEPVVLAKRLVGKGAAA